MPSFHNATHQFDYILGMLSSRSRNIPNQFDYWQGTYGETSPEALLSEAEQSSKSFESQLLATIILGTVEEFETICSTNPEELTSDLLTFGVRLKFIVSIISVSTDPCIKILLM